MPADTYIRADAGTRWVKLSILLDAPTNVYFQYGNSMPFHLDVLRKHVSTMEALTPSEFGSLR